MVSTKNSEPFDLYGGHPALDLVNTLSHRFRGTLPSESLHSYQDLLGFMQQEKIFTALQARRLLESVEPEAAERALASARDLREALASALYASSDGAAPSSAVLQTLKSHFLNASRHQVLRWTPQAQSPERPGMSWVWGRFEQDAMLPVWMLSQSANDLLLSDAIGRVRACGVDSCRWLFLDTSKNHSRRWCNMKKCGNRMKARRFQARQED